MTPHKHNKLSPNTFPTFCSPPPRVQCHRMDDTTTTGPQVHKLTSALWSNRMASDVKKCHRRFGVSWELGRDHYWWTNRWHLRQNWYCHPGMDVKIVSWLTSLVIQPRVLSTVGRISEGEARHLVASSSCWLEWFLQKKCCLNKLISLPRRPVISNIFFLISIDPSTSIKKVIWYKIKSFYYEDNNKFTTS